MKYFAVVFVAFMALLKRGIFPTWSWRSDKVTSSTISLRGLHHNSSLTHLILQSSHGTKTKNKIFRFNHPLKLNVSLSEFWSKISLSNVPSGLYSRKLRLILYIMTAPLHHMANATTLSWPYPISLGHSHLQKESTKWHEADMK